MGVVWAYALGAIMVYCMFVSSDQYRIVGLFPNTAVHAYVDAGCLFGYTAPPPYPGNDVVSRYLVPVGIRGIIRCVHTHGIKGG